MDFDFLHGYYEPTLLILYEPVKTFAGRIAVRKDTFAMVSIRSCVVIVTGVWIYMIINCKMYNWLKKKAQNSIYSKGEKNFAVNLIREQYSLKVRKLQMKLVN